MDEIYCLLTTINVRLKYLKKKFLSILHIEASKQTKNKRKRGKKDLDWATNRSLYDANDKEQWKNGKKLKFIEFAVYCTPHCPTFRNSCSDHVNLRNILWEFQSISSLTIIFRLEVCSVLFIAANLIIQSEIVFLCRKSCQNYHNFMTSLLSA